MFSVESLIREEALRQTMEMMRTWLDHQHLEPAIFRYTFASDGVVFRVDFTVESEAAAFCGSLWRPDRRLAERSDGLIS